MKLFEMAGYFVRIIENDAAVLTSSDNVINVSFFVANGRAK
jgi:hypothetical protein